MKVNDASPNKDVDFEPPPPPHLNIELKLETSFPNVSLYYASK